MLIYITWRFEFKFAVGAIVALFHDVIITLGVFSVLQLEITLPIIAAFLTINFLQQSERIDDHAVSDNTNCVFVKNT